ncbi:MAG: four helix bundle protein [Gemmatimonadaceae bacterium]
MSDFRRLEVWRRSHALVLNVHRAAKKIRGSDYVSLRSQMLRSAMSIPTNLVEGVGQRSAREFSKFIRIALNSANELEYHLQVARDFEVLSSEEFITLQSETIQVRKMLHGLLRTVQARSQDAAPTSSHRSSPATGNGATPTPQHVIPESAETVASS